MLQYKLLDNGIIDENNPIFKQDGIDMLSVLADKYSITDANGNIIGYDMENYTIDIAFDGDRTKFDKFLTQYETDIDNAIQVNKNKMDKANRELYSYNKAIIRQLGENAPNTLGEILENATDEYNIVLDKIALNFSSAGKSQEEIKKEFANIIETTANIFGDNNDILENGLMNAEDFDTLGNYNDARIALEKLLKEKFGNNVNAWSNEQLEIAIALGFEVDENNAIKALNDSENIFNQINQLAQERGVNLDFSNVSYSQRDAVTNLISSGALDGLSDDEGQAVFNKMLQAEGPTDKSSYGWGQYLGYLTNESQGDLMNEAITNIIGDLDISKVKNLTKDQLDDVGKIIDKELAGLPLSVRGSLKNVINDINSGAKDVADDADLGNILTENLYGSIGLEKIDAYKEQVSATLQEVFDDFESFDLDNSGLIDSFEELKKVLDSIESSFKALRSAQEEYNATGELTLGTVLELIATDSNFIDLLDTSGEKIILKANAEEILAAAQLDATKTSMELALANEEERAATLKAEIKELEKGEAVVQVSEATNEQIEALRQSVTALDSETTSLMKNAYAAIADAEAKNGNTEAANSALKNVTSVADIKTAFSASGAATTVTLTTFESRLARAMKDSEELNKLYGAAEGTKWYEEYTDDKGEQQLRFVDRTSDYVRYNADGTVANYNGGSLGVWQKAINGLTLDMFKANKYSYDSNKSSSNNTSKDPLTELDKIKALLSALNKEYYQMIVYGEMGLNNLKENADVMHEMYYESMRSVLEQAIEKSKEALGGMTINDIYQIDDKDTFNKMMGYYEDMQKYHVQLNNLDDEEIQDRIKILELQNADKKTMIEQYKILVKTADTLEEALEYQKQLYEMRKSQLQDELQIAEYQEQSLQNRRDILLKQLSLEQNRGSSAKDAYEYITNGSSGDRALDKIAEIIQEAKDEWNEADRKEKTGEISKEIAKELKDAAHEKAEEARSQAGYESSIDGTGFNALEKDIAPDVKEIERITKEIRDLDREEIENTIKRYESQNISYELINDQLLQLYALAKTDEQKVEILERIEENQKKQYDLIKGIKEFQVTKNNFELEYLNPYLNTERYTYLKEQNKQMYKEIQANAKAEYSRLWNKIYNDNIAAGATPEQASRMAYGNSDVQAALQDYMDAYKAYGDVIMSVIEDKLEHIQWHIDKLEKEKPQEWASIKQIEKFEKNEIALYQQKLNVLWEQLQDIKDITDDQIKYMVDEYNDAFKAIHDMRIQALSDKLGYQDNVLEAIRFAVDTQIKDLEFQQEIIEKIYDEELKKLKDKEDSYERTNKLIELQNKLLDANKEKERVYRQGIGWVYETNRNKVKTAQQNIDAFNRQDRINDLEQSKENDIKRIADEIEGWDDYLEALEWQYEQWQHEENMRLLKEVLGVESDQEVYDLLKEDMKAYREYRKNAIDGNQMFSDIETGITGKIESLGQNFDWLGNRVVVLGQEVDGVIQYFTYTIEEANRLFGLAINDWLDSGKPFWQWLMEGFDGVFQHFLDEHYQNEKEYHDLMREELDLLDIDDFLIGNELPEGWDLPDAASSTMQIKKKEYQTLWDVVLSDKNFVNARAMNGEDVTSDNTMSFDGYIDYSNAMAKAIRDQDWEALDYYAILRNVKAENLGYDISGNTEGFRSNEQVAIDAYKQYYKNIDEEVTKGFIDTQRELIKASNESNANYKTIEIFLDNAINREINTVKTTSGQEIGIQKTSTGELKAVLYDGNGQIKTQLTKSEQEMVNNYTEQANLSRTLLDLNTARELKGMDELGKATIAEQINQGLRYTLALNESTGKLELQMIDDNGRLIQQINEENASILGFKNTTATNLNNIKTQQMNAEKVLKVSQDNDIVFNSEMSHLINSVGSLIDTDLSDEMVPKLVEMVTALGEQYGLLTDVADESSDQNSWLSKMQGDTQSLQEAVLEILAASGASQDVIERVEQNGLLYTMANSGFSIDDVSDLKGISTSNLSDSTLRAYSSAIQEINKLSEQWWATEDKDERANLAAQALKIGQAAGLTRNQEGSWSDASSTYSVAAAHAKSTVTDSKGNSYTASYSDSSGSYTGSSRSAYNYISDSSSSGNTQLDNVKSAIEKAKADWDAANALGDEAGKAAAHAAAEAARASVGYSGGADGSQYIATRANGIEGGPITYTGLAMLHGSKTSPEYVLNSDQAYNILRYIATGNRPQDNIESYNNSVTKATQYIVEGDIILENVDNPAEFWDEVTTAMGNRWNVTKNR